eukprot:TRINITY_DN4316_c0_g2_i1.p1 TRINITY_DN4316_c0_g2~~TRINITY_DN4316_c0_g2_i1.p1  ORF type:complete len:632 (-),score=128.95 TRINITY_DN4316_c0_g2_i1:552-2447(-)
MQGQANLAAQLAFDATQRWLTSQELFDILSNHPWFGLTVSDTVANCPPSGSVFLYDKSVVKHFRKDGHDWQKRPGGGSVREGHENLKINGVIRLVACYAHGASNPTFHRRVYWLLNNPRLVLVHYFDDHNNDNPIDRTLATQEHNYRLSAARAEFASQQHQQQQQQQQQHQQDFGHFNPISQVFQLQSFDQMQFDVGDAQAAPAYSLVEHDRILLDQQEQQQRALEEYLRAQHSEEVPIIADVAPSWDSPSGGAKVLITGSGWDSGAALFVMFDRTQVVAEHVVPGVLRCRAPAHEPGSVPLSITRGDHISISNATPFEYRHSEPKHTDWTSFGDRELLVRMLEHLDALSTRLFSTSELSSSGLGSLSSTPASHQDYQSRQVGAMLHQLQNALVMVIRSCVRVQWRGLETRDSHGLCLLHYAAGLGFLDVADALLAAGVQVDVLSYAGTPLHAAVMRAHANMVVLLLKSGANPFAVDWRGRTPVDIASGRHQHTAAARALHQYADIARIGAALDAFTLSMGQRSGAELSRAAMRIQVAFRRHRRPKANTLTPRMHAAAARIQKWFRTRREQQEVQSAAMKIQRAFRGHRATVSAKKQRQELFNAAQRTHTAATRIQTAFRRHRRSVDLLGF